jgi:hypothetical protein
MNTRALCTLRRAAARRVRMRVARVHGALALALRLLPLLLLASSAAAHPLRPDCAGCARRRAALARPLCFFSCHG